MAFWDRLDRIGWAVIVMAGAVFLLGLWLSMERGQGVGLVAFVTALLLASQGWRLRRLAARARAARDGPD